MAFTWVQWAAMDMNGHQWIAMSSDEFQVPDVGFGSELLVHTLVKRKEIKRKQTKTKGELG
jgi:hypothetical protein